MNPGSTEWCSEALALLQIWQRGCEPHGLTGKKTTKLVDALFHSATEKSLMIPSLGLSSAGSPRLSPAHEFVPSVFVKKFPPAAKEETTNKVGKM